ncbi:hypothetical protein HaLaN_15803 [Haematococcus lacustris]|uniref:Uncharacterized protein n=1 Tax=Haematococcus lacustris TaxID=44745 RepID=A0A699ZIL2_HAELA|nr:hypothetical protein HaLaN_15803 [Haematococcus lacustris]
MCSLVMPTAWCHRGSVSTARTALRAISGHPPHHLQSLPRLLHKPAAAGGHCWQKGFRCVSRCAPPRPPRLHHQPTRPFLEDAVWNNDMQSGKFSAGGAHHVCASAQAAPAWRPYILGPVVPHITCTVAASQCCIHNCCLQALLSLEPEPRCTQGQWHTRSSRRGLQHTSALRGAESGTAAPGPWDPELDRVHSSHYCSTSDQDGNTQRELQRWQV